MNLNKFDKKKRRRQQKEDRLDRNRDQWMGNGGAGANEAGNNGVLTEGVVNRGRGGPKKTPEGCATITSATTSGCATNTSASGSGRATTTSATGNDRCAKITSASVAVGCAKSTSAPTSDCAMITSAF